MKSKILFLVGGICLSVLLALSSLRSVDFSHLMSSVLDDCSEEQATLTNAQNALENNQNQLAQLPSREMLEQQGQELGNQLVSTNTQITQLQSTINSLLSQLKTKGYTSVAEFEKVLERKTTELDSRTKQNTKLEQEYLRLSQIRPSTTQIQKSMSSLRTQINANKSAIASLTTFIKNLREIKSSLIDPLKSKTAELSTAQATLSRLTNDRNAVQHQMDARARLEGEQTDLQEDVNNAQQALNECENGGACGNGIQEGAEECDLGEKNTDSGKCTLNCTLYCDYESHYVNGSPPIGYHFLKSYHPKSLDDADFVFVTPPSGVDPYEWAKELPHSCIIAKTDCGNGVVEPPEQCDDGNNNDDDGCNFACTIEKEDDYVCGNGILEGVEDCDDGNTTDGDGCSATCTKEDEPVCGNGKIEPPEECETDADVPPGYICLDCKKAEVRNP